MSPATKGVKLVVVIPAFNESLIIYRVIKALPKKVKGIDKIEILVVDDGSTDATSKEAKKTNAYVISHIINRGVGAATKTGIEWAKQQNADIIATFDADGQHDPLDLVKIIKPIIVGQADLVIGSRLKKRQKIPIDRFLINWFANFVTFFLFGVFSTDSQSGLRAFTKKAIAKINLKNDRMEFSSEVLSEAKRHNLRIVEVPTRAIYTKYSREKGQSNLNAIPVAARLLIRFLR